MNLHLEIYNRLYSILKFKKGHLVIYRMKFEVIQLHSSSKDDRKYFKVGSIAPKPIYLRFYFE